MNKSILAVYSLLLSLLIVCGAPVRAQGVLGASAADWTGTWIAQGTLFSVAVTVQEDQFRVNEVQSLGFVWTSEPGSVAGDQATLEVKYAGVTARILARLTGDGRAVVEAASCLPEFMVVCVLAKGQQAVFVRQDSQ
ncbi:MAG: hypothetical protein R3F50_03485 [Gammaproteobacteria bacterium]